MAYHQQVPAQPSPKGEEEQLYASDKYVSGKPLLEIMAQPDTSFYKALAAFKKKDVFANCVNDRTVPFATGYFPADYKDMFAKADKIGRSISDDAEGVDAQVEKGGLSNLFLIVAGSHHPVFCSTHERWQSVAFQG
jgi:hypothetical protein